MFGKRSGSENDSRVAKAPDVVLEPAAASPSANPALLFEISTGKVLYSEDVDDV